MVCELYDSNAVNTHTLSVTHIHTHTHRRLLLETTGSIQPLPGTRPLSWSPAPFTATVLEMPDTLIFM